jgi:hypothetical protein
VKKNSYYCKRKKLKKRLWKKSLEKRHKNMLVFKKGNYKNRVLNNKNGLKIKQKYEKRKKRRKRKY